MKVPYCRPKKGYAEIGRKSCMGRGVNQLGALGMTKHRTCLNSEGWQISQWFAFPYLQEGLDVRDKAHRCRAKHCGVSAWSPRHAIKCGLSEVHIFAIFTWV